MGTHLVCYDIDDDTVISEAINVEFWDLFISKSDSNRSITIKNGIITIIMNPDTSEL